VAWPVHRLLGFLVWGGGFSVELIGITSASPHLSGRGEQVEGLGGGCRGESADEGEEEDEGAEVLLPDQERRGCAGRRLQVAEVRPEGCQEQPPSKVLYSNSIR